VRRLLAEADFRRAYAAGAISQLGDAFQFIALMWFAVATGGPLGVIAVRIGTSLPSLLFGLHGGAFADRRNRRRTMIAADLVRAAVLVPVTVAGLSGHLPLWALVPAGFAISTATSYFQPAFGALLPSLVRCERVQEANALVNGTRNVLYVSGWAFAAALLTFVPVGWFFGVNAATFALSALFLLGIRARERIAMDAEQPSRIRDGFASLRVRPGLDAAVAMLGLGMTVMTGVWTVGVAELAHSRLGGASALAGLLAATAAGEIAVAAFLARHRVRRKVFASCLAWLVLPPGYVLLATANGVAVALAGTFLVGLATGAAYVLVTTATQESIEDGLLGRAMGVVFLGNAGTKTIGLALIAPLYLVVGADVMFLAGALVVACGALATAAAVSAATRRALAMSSS
jgi:Transmembrane secretion effector